MSSPKIVPSLTQDMYSPGVAIPLLLLYSLVSLVASDKLTTSNETVIEIKTCQELNILLAKQENPVCKCYSQGMSSSRIWLGCPSVNMPQLHAALNAFDQIIYIPGLKIWASQIFTLQPSFFNKIRVQNLVIEGSGLGRFRPGPFEPLAGYLETLDLKDNSIQSFHSDVFSGLNKLRFLDLSRNNIKSLNPHVFDSLQALQVLLLHRNQISSVSESVFANLPNLDSLNLHSNELTVVKYGTFDGLGNLDKHLDLSKNGIIEIEDGSFDALKNVKQLNLAENNLSHLVLNGLDSLTTLKLNNNSIHSEKVLSFTNLPSLDTLYLDGNFLRVLGQSESLYAAMPALKTLSASKNNIEQVYAHNLPTGLHKLLVQYNSINVSPPHGWGPSSLLVLQLGHNDLESISDDDFRNLEDLLTLGLGGNRIESVSDKALQRNQRLQRFYINSNLVSHVPDAFVQLLPQTLIATDWSDNPWQCTCMLTRLALWLKEHAETMFSSQLTRCNVSNQRLMQMAEPLGRNCDGSGVSRPSTQPWLTAVAGVMGAASLLMIIAGILLFLQNLLVQQQAASSKAVNKAGQLWPTSRTVHGVRVYDLSRVPSDMVRLIPNNTHTDTQTSSNNTTLEKKNQNDNHNQKKVHFEETA